MSDRLPSRAAVAGLAGLALAAVVTVAVAEGVTAGLPAAGPARPLAGVGLLLGPDPAGHVRVAAVTEGSPADAAGLEPGDVLTEVSTRPTRGLRPADVAAALRGEAGTQVRLSWRRGAAQLAATLTRTTPRESDVVVADEPFTVGGAPVARVVLTGFRAGTAAALARTLEDLRAAGVAGVLLDLRGNPGGRLDEAVRSAGVFLDGGPVVRVARRDAVPVTVVAPAGGDVLTRVVVLVDGGTASAAEVLAAALQERGRAVVVGSRTFGKGTVQEQHAVAGLGDLSLTVAQWSTPDGRSVEGLGLSPDVGLSVATEHPSVVRRGVEVLGGLLAGGVGVSGGGPR